jgi:malate dehydrogenase (oxaloacetate-decarboxylating)
MKIAAANAIAGYVRNPSREHIMPPVFDRKVVRAIAMAVREAAIASGVARDVG